MTADGKVAVAYLQDSRCFRVVLGIVFTNPDFPDIQSAAGHIHGSGAFAPSAPTEKYQVSNSGVASLDNRTVGVS